MARKRIISPEIWESPSFSKLSDFAKLVFIGLISNADDSGKGVADACLLKSKLFPRDEKKRVADVKSALSEIARSTSTIFYEVEGNDYYIFTNWTKWQKIDRPTPSKLPNPPETTGERGRITQNQNFDEDSTNFQRGLDEGSATNRIERNRIEDRIKYPPISPQEGEGSDKELFFQSYPKLKPLERFDDSAIDYKALLSAFKDSDVLRRRFSMRWVYENYEAIIAGEFSDEAMKPDFRTESEKAVDSRAERERFYSDRKHAAEVAAEKNRRRAANIKGYNENERLIQTTYNEWLNAFLHDHDNTSRISELEKKKGDLVKKRCELLALIGLTEEDLQPKPFCTKCNDTGFLPSGIVCDCYTRKH